MEEILRHKISESIAPLSKSLSSKGFFSQNDNPEYVFRTAKKTQRVNGRMVGLKEVYAQRLNDSYIPVLYRYFGHL